MARVDTLPEILRPLMMGVSVETPHCAICGRTWPLQRHHIVRRSAGKLYRGGVELPKPTVMLCGSGNASGCHGLAHQNRLHFRWVRPREAFNRPTPQGSGHWEYLITDEPMRYQRALEMDGWRPLPDFDALQ